MKGLKFLNRIEIYVQKYPFFSFYCVFVASSPQATTCSHDSPEGNRIQGVNKLHIMLSLRRPSGPQKRRKVSYLLFVASVFMCSGSGKFILYIASLFSKFLLSKLMISSKL